jgi:hypothetical protein
MLIFLLQLRKIEKNIIFFLPYKSQNQSSYPTNDSQQDLEDEAAKCCLHAWGQSCSLVFTISILTLLQCPSNHPVNLYRKTWVVTLTSNFLFESWGWPRILLWVSVCVCVCVCVCMCEKECVCIVLIMQWKMTNVKKVTMSSNMVC